MSARLNATSVRVCCCNNDGYMFGIQGRVGCSHCDEGEEWVRVHGGDFCCYVKGVQLDHHGPTPIDRGTDGR